MARARPLPEPNVHLEILLELLPDADRDELQRQLRGVGLDPLPMKAGILLSAEHEDLKRLLPQLSGTETGAIPVPDQLKKLVGAIRIFKPRSLH